MQIPDYPGRVQMILSLRIWCSFNVFQNGRTDWYFMAQLLEYILIGISIKKLLIDRFSSSMINALIMEGGDLLMGYILTGFHPKLFGAK
ncbi:hypothetical protein IGV49_002188 [Salmonella enterica subsp. enterica serovar Newport]|nr:hypothetical protein [Salmonella enterica subsp. enterica serovar Newport]